MRKPEQLAWDQMRVAMEPFWVAQRHEDKHSVGIPDLSFSLSGGRTGWVELKAADDRGRFRIRPAQILWARRRAALGTDCLLMVRSSVGWAGINYRHAEFPGQSFDSVASAGHFGTAVEVFSNCMEIGYGRLQNIRRGCSKNDEIDRQRSFAY